MNTEDLARSVGLSKSTVKTIKKDGFLHSKDDEVGILTALSSLMVARFSYEQIKTMHDSPDKIRSIFEEHVREMTDGDYKYPTLCALLKKVSLTDVQNVFQLGERMGEALFVPEDKAAQVEDIRNKCRELRDKLEMASDEYSNSNMDDFFSMIPIIGIFAGFGRSKSLSDAGDLIKEAYELNDSLSESLSGLELNLDIAFSETVNELKGKFYDWSAPHVSTGNYILETTERIDKMKERVFVIIEQMNRLPIKSI